MEQNLRLAQHSLDHAQDAIFRIGQDARITYVNDAACRHLGYSKDELLALSIPDIDPDFTIEAWGKYWEDVTITGWKRFETRHKRKDGAIVPVEITTRLMEFEGAFYSLASVRDITERKKIEQSLRLAQFSLDHAQDAIFRMSRDARITYVNDAACRHLGYSKDELLALSIPDIDPDFTIEAWDNFWEHVTDAGGSRFETRHKRKDGTIVPVEIVSSSIEYDGELHHFASVRDITERKHAEQMLAEQTRELLDCIEHASVSMQWVGPDGIVLWANRATLDLLGYTSEDYIGHHVTDFHVDQPEIQDIFDRLNRGEVVQQHVARLRSKDGSIKDVLIDSSVFWKDSKFVHTNCFTRDITERKRMEEELQRYRHHLEALVQERTGELVEAKETAEAANKAKSQFLGRMSHELRTPLNAILGFAQILEADDPDTPIGDELEGIQTIISSGWALQRIISDLLDLTAIEANKIDLHIESVNLEQVIGGCLNTMSPMAQSLQNACHVSPSCRGLFILADAFRLKQVLLNLLSNAVKYNREGGNVTVSCQRMQPNRIRIAVTDTGPGIAEEDYPTLFEAFARLHQRPYEIEGAGVGLAVTKQLTELMKGAIGVESVVGQGSTFWVEFEAGEAPASIQAADIAVKGKAAEVEPGKQTKLLYIEDNPSHVRLMQRIIRDMGNIELLTAHTPNLGLELAYAHRPTIILTDICLPGMNGFALLEHLRSDPRTSDIPVVALSASAMPQDIEKGLRAGFRRYLTKPINAVEFARTLTELLIDEASANDQSGE